MAAGRTKGDKPGKSKRRTACGGGWRFPAIYGTAAGNPQIPFQILLACAQTDCGSLRSSRGALHCSSRAADTLSSSAPKCAKEGRRPASRIRPPRREVRTDTWRLPKGKTLARIRYRSKVWRQGPALRSRSEERRVGR